MNFKKWLLKTEIADNYGADLPKERPDKQLEDQLKRGVGAMPVYSSKMKKKLKKK